MQCVVRDGYCRRGGTLVGSRDQTEKAMHREVKADASKEGLVEK
jgi:hypothetical protein